MHGQLVDMAMTSLLGGFVASSLLGSAVTLRFRRPARSVTKRSSEEGS